jgi:hypothetical protein
MIHSDKDRVRIGQPKIGGLSSAAGGFIVLFARSWINGFNASIEQESE